MRPLLLAVLVLYAGTFGTLATTGAVEAADPVADAALEVRLNGLAAELRCLVCQNQSLADSNAELAVDLKNQVRDMMRAGKSDDEIKTYLTDRYGDFVLYRPPMRATTWLLWAGPFVLLGAGGILLVRVLRRRQASLAAAESQAVAGGPDLARARSLLAEPPADPRP
jgi:cytochrome c-type biogenesis protein CcmH